MSSIWQINYKPNKMKKNDQQEACSTKDLIAVKDTLEVLSGKWRLPVLISLLNGAKRFNEISRDVAGISDRMLSKELKDLESNQLVTRTVYDSFPPVVEYNTTEHALSLHNIIYDLKIWGYLHREKILGS